MKKLLCLLAGTFLIFACSPKVTKIELMNELKTKNFCEGIACEKGVIINENMNRMLLDCLEEAWEPLPNDNYIISTKIYSS
jgi:hypothetical protein